MKKYSDIVFIYTLSHENVIRYIGISNNVDKRFGQHINESKNKNNKVKYNSHKSNWIRKVKDIKIDVIDICEKRKIIPILIYTKMVSIGYLKALYSNLNKNI